MNLKSMKSKLCMYLLLSTFITVCCYAINKDKVKDMIYSDVLFINRSFELKLFLPCVNCPVDKESVSIVKMDSFTINLSNKIYKIKAEFNKPFFNSEDNQKFEYLILCSQEEYYMFDGFFITQAQFWFNRESKLGSGTKSLKKELKPILAEMDYYRKPYKICNFISDCTKKPNNIFKSSILSVALPNESYYSIVVPCHTKNEYTTMTPKKR